MIDLDRTFFIKKEYISLVSNYFTEEQYSEYIRAVVDYSVFGKCEIKSPEVYAVFMYVKYDIDKEKRTIKNNQKKGRKPKFTVNELIWAIEQEHITSVDELANYFHSDRVTVNRRLKEVKPLSKQTELRKILKK